MNHMRKIWNQIILTFMVGKHLEWCHLTWILLCVCVCVCVYLCLCVCSDIRTVNQVCGIYE